MSLKALASWDSLTHVFGFMYTTWFTYYNSHCSCQSLRTQTMVSNIPEAKELLICFHVLATQHHKFITASIAASGAEVIARSMSC